LNVYPAGLTAAFFGQTAKIYRDLVTFY